MRLIRAFSVGMAVGYLIWSGKGSQWFHAIESRSQMPESGHSLPPRATEPHSDFASSPAV